MPDKELVARVRGRLTDDFALRLLDGAIAVLAHDDNPARVHQSASSFRELIAHVLESMAPDADVTRCGWFEQIKDLKGPSRRQRALYACRGGLLDAFLKERLGIKPSQLFAGFGESFAELNKRTHVRKETELTDEREIDEFVNGALLAIEDVFETIDELRGRVTSAVGRELHGAAVSGFVNRSIQELDEIAGRYSPEMVWIEDAVVEYLDADKIVYRIAGTVDVDFIAGPRADEAIIAQSFPYRCTTSAPAGAPTEFDHDDTIVTVDTKAWFGDGDEEELAEVAADGACDGPDATF
ncbi:hypothetical protein [Bradyrhizobium tunisiense]|uniref:pPIWI-associating nuclease domain-containing protein n=1 Tax=Bradyrhizobium tunisiense TaxID=3278709 RepID=UPI0035E2CAAF